MHRITLAAAMAWCAAWLLSAIGAVYAQGAAYGGSADIHLTPGALGVIIGIVAVIAPAFYAVGRFNQRLTTVEKQIEQLILRGVEISERIARAVERLHEDPPPNSDPNHRLR